MRQREWRLETACHEMPRHTHTQPEPADLCRRAASGVTRIQAKFGDKTVHFGARGGETFVDHGDQAKKEAWIARHKARENWADLQTAGALAKRCGTNGR